jgi:hypothetical protein
MSTKARTLLLERVQGIYAAERERYEQALGAMTISDGQVRRLGQAAEAVRAAR